MNKLTSIRIKQDDGTYSDDIPVQVLAENVVWDETSSNSIVDIIGQVDLDTNGSIQSQITLLDNRKLNIADLNSYIASQISIDVTNWLSNNVNPVGSAVTVDQSLTISGSAADSKVVGDNITDLKKDLNNLSQFNPMDLFRKNVTYTDKTTGGVSFTWNSDKTECSVVGTTGSSRANYNLYVNYNKLPEGIEPGNSYRVKCYISDNRIVSLVFLLYFDGASTGGREVIFKADGKLNIPDNCTGMIIRFIVNPNNTVNVVVNNIAVLNAKTNVELANEIDTLNESVTNNFTLLGTDLLDAFGVTDSSELQGITYTYRKNGIWKVNGTLSQQASQSFKNIIYSPEMVPSWIERNKKYHVRFDNANFKIVCRLYLYRGDTIEYINSYSDFDFSVDESVTGINMRLYIIAHEIVFDDIITIQLFRTNETYVDMDNITYISRTVNGITFTWNEDNSECVVTGTTTSNALTNLYYEQTTIPDWLIPGQAYKIIFDSSDDNILFEIGCFFENGSSTLFINHKPFVFNVPITTVGFYMRIKINHLSTVNGSISNIKLYRVDKRKSKAPIYDRYICTIIDDDTSRNEYVDRFYNACKHNGVVGNYAVMTQHIEDNNVDINKLLEYEGDGFGMLLHCSNQNNSYWRPTGPNIDEQRKDLTKAIRFMKTNGLLSSNHWVVPGGRKEARTEKLGRFFNFDSVITTSDRYYNNYEHIDKYRIMRQAYDPEGDQYSRLDAVKSLIDIYVKEGGNGVLVLCTHFNAWGTEEWDTSLDENGYQVGYPSFNNLIQYIINHGIEIVSYPEAFSHMKKYIDD